MTPEARARLEAQANKDYGAWLKEAWSDIRISPWDHEFGRKAFLAGYLASHDALGARIGELERAVQSAAQSFSHARSWFQHPKRHDMHACEASMLACKRQMEAALSPQPPTPERKEPAGRVNYLLSEDEDINARSLSVSALLSGAGAAVNPSTPQGERGEAFEPCIEYNAEAGFYEFVSEDAPGVWRIYAPRVEVCVLMEDRNRVIGMRVFASGEPSAPLPAEVDALVEEAQAFLDHRRPSADRPLADDIVPRLAAALEAAARRPGENDVQIIGVANEVAQFAAETKRRADRLLALFGDGK